MLRFSCTLAVLASLVCFSSAHGSIVVDQSQTVGATFALSPVDPVLNTSVQSFASGPGVTNISGARIALAAGSVSNISVVIYSVISEGSPASTGITPSVVASHTLNGPFTGAQIVQVDLPAPVSILPNTTYYLEFSGALGDSGFFGGTTDDLYSNGFAITDANRSGFTEFPNFDFYFETLTDTSFVAAAIPEPCAASLYAAFVTAALLRRRRQVTASN